jgi:dihydroorotate dehydrogenase (NAD+) catalytic subunit
MIYQAKQRVKIPIVGMGGISKWEDAVEILLAGAAALQIGTAFFTDPYTPIKVLKGINQYLDNNKISRVTELTGKVIPWN